MGDRPLSYACPRLVGSWDFTGDLAAGMWAAAPWTEQFVDIEGDRKPQPPLATRAKMLWSDSHFLVGAFLEEPHVWATLTEHDSVIFQDNDFEVFLDPDGDALNYFEFEINALNTTWDLFLAKPYRDGGSADNAWESEALTRVTVHGTLNDASDIDQGWTVELGFPWEAFKGHSRPAPGDTWRINFSRVEWDVEVVEGKTVKVPERPEHNWVWSPQGLIDMHQPERWGFVQFKG